MYSTRIYLHINTRAHLIGHLDIYIGACIEDGVHHVWSTIALAQKAALTSYPAYICIHTD